MSIWTVSIRTFTPCEPPDQSPACQQNSIHQSFLGHTLSLSLIPSRLLREEWEKHLNLISWANKGREVCNYECMGNPHRACISNFDKLNLMWWFEFRRKSIFAATTAVLEKTAIFKSGQKWPKNNHTTFFTKLKLSKYLIHFVFHIHFIRHFRESEKARETKKWRGNVVRSRNNKSRNFFFVDMKNNPT